MLWGKIWRKRWMNLPLSRCLRVTSMIKMNYHCFWMDKEIGSMTWLRLIWLPNTRPNPYWCSLRKSKCVVITRNSWARISATSSRLIPSLTSTQVSSNWEPIWSNLELIGITKHSLNILNGHISKLLEIQHSRILSRRRCYVTSKSPKLSGRL